MKLEFEILPDEHTAVVRYCGIKILFDTGASTPVWCAGINNFKDMFPNAEKRNYRFLLTGFGRSETELRNFINNPNDTDAQEYFVDVYSIPEFILEKGGSKITWGNLNVAVAYRQFYGVHLILPYTMFKSMKLGIDHETMPAKLSLVSSKDTIAMFVQLRNNLNKKLLKTMSLKNVKEQTPEICLEAVKKDAPNLAYVKKQTPEICLATDM